MTAQRTYWHLEGRGRVPTDYEVATTELLYHPKQGIGVRTPGAEWLERHGTRMGCASWDRFEDPRATTYASYTALQAQRAQYVETVFDTVGDADAALPGTWLRAAQELIAPLRYPAHALQMVAAYAGSMAPGGRLVVALAFQTGDAMRVVELLSRRLAQLRRLHPTIADSAAQLWQSAPAWQAWRRPLERLLVSYDWDEALLALNLVVKPAFDELFLGVLAQGAQRHADDTTQRVLGSLREDAAWHRDWTRALLQLLAAEDAANLQRANEVASHWLAPMRDAARASGEQLAPLVASTTPEIVGRVDHALAEHMASLGLAPGLVAEGAA